MADGSGAIDPKTIEAIDIEIKRIGGDVKAHGDSLGREVAGMRALIDETGKKTDTLIDERIGKFAAAVETKQLALETGLADVSASVDKALTALNRTPGGFRGDNDGADDAAYQFTLAKMARAGELKIQSKVEPDHKAVQAWQEQFKNYLRLDERAHHQTDAYRAALQTGSDPDGGYLVPPEMSQRIVTKVFETSPMRQLATVENIGGKELEIPRDVGEFGYGWVGEQQARPETTTSQFGLSKIVAHEMYASPKATQNMLEDAGIDIEAWMANKVGDKFSRVEATAFFTGTGVGQPRGLLTYANGTADGQIEQIVSGAATDFTFDGLINLIYALKDPYAANTSFLFNRLGVRNVSKLKDSQNRYLWEPSRQKGEPSQLMGYDVRRAADIAAPGAGALMAAFGDFKTAYTIVDRLGITTLRDPFTAKPYVVFYTRRRVGGDVVNFEAVKLMVGST